MPASHEYCVERISTTESLESLRDEWRALIAADPGASVFLTWEWVSTWWRHRGSDWELWVLTADDPEGRLAGIAPLALTRHRRGPAEVRRLAFAGDNQTYRVHLDFIARPTEKAEVATAFLGYLRSQRQAWDVLDLEALAEASPVKAVLARVQGLSYHENETLPCPWTPLPATWETYEREGLSANRRQQLRNRRSRLQRDHPGQVSFRRVRMQAEIPPAIEAMATLHRQRWLAKGRGSKFDHADFTAFQQELAALCLERGWLRLYLLEVAGQPIAVEHLLLYRGVLFDYEKAFDPAWAQYSPGQVLMAHLLREAIAEGACELDLGRGEFDYKFSWSEQVRLDSHVFLTTSLPGRAWWYGRAAYRAMRSAARDHVPAAARQRINRLLSARP